MNKILMCEICVTPLELAKSIGWFCPNCPPTLEWLKGANWKDEVAAKPGEFKEVNYVHLTAAKRKRIPLASGVLDYFPLALCAVAECSHKGNDQHNPGQPLHWAREKSGDHRDALMRHLIDKDK